MDRCDRIRRLAQLALDAIRSDMPNKEALVNHYLGNALAEQDAIDRLQDRARLKMMMEMLEMAEWM